MSLSTNAFFYCSLISPPTNLDCEAGGSGRPAWALKTSTNSMNNICQCACGCLSVGGGGRRSVPHFHSLGRHPSTGGAARSLGSCRSCSWYQGYKSHGSFLSWALKSSPPHPPSPCGPSALLGTCCAGTLPEAPNGACPALPCVCLCMCGWLFHTLPLLPHCLTNVHATWRSQGTDAGPVGGRQGGQGGRAGPLRFVPSSPTPLPHFAGAGPRGTRLFIVQGLQFGNGSSGTRDAAVGVGGLVSQLPNCQRFTTTNRRFNAKLVVTANSQTDLDLSAEEKRRSSLFRKKNPGSCEKMQGVSDGLSHVPALTFCLCVSSFSKGKWGKERCCQKHLK